MRTYSTKQAAELADIHWVTLHRWIADGRVRASVAVKMNGSILWRWTAADVAQVRKYKAEHYRKGRGRKKAIRGRPREKSRK